jgi:hypothetical protein
VTRREIGFLVIGLGSGLLLAVFAILAVLRSLSRNAFIISYGWDKAILIVPLGLIVLGAVLILYKTKIAAK